MNSIMMAVEEEKQERGRAFMLARQRLEIEYNCTTTIVPKWLLGVSGTFVLGFDEQVMVGPAPLIPQKQEEGTDET